MGHRIKDIEFLRGIAVLGVLIYHARDNLISWTVPTWDHIVTYYFDFWPGVDLFFAISGFVIARTLIPTLRAVPDHTAFFRAVIIFWVRRAFRLLPSAWFWLAFVLFASVFLNRTGLFATFHTNFESTIAAMLSLANVREADAFQNYAYGPTAPYWSLSLEEQFYFALPIAAFLAGKRLPIVLGLGLAFVFLRPETPWLMMFRVHAILLGVLLALFSETPAYVVAEPVFLRRFWPARLVVLLLLLGMIASLAPIREHINLSKIDVIALLSVALVFIASYNRDYLCPDCGIKRVILWVGTRSYAIYLIHIPAFYLAREIWRHISPHERRGDGPLLLLIAATLLAVLSELNYRCLELPFRARGLAAARGLAVGPEPDPRAADTKPEAHMHSAA